MRIVLISMLVLLTFGSSLAQWSQTNGPFGGDVQAIASSGNDLFVGTNGGWIWHSTNDGNTWSKLTPPSPIADNATNLIFKDSIFFAMEPVYRSTDTGSTWTYVGNNFNWGGVTSLEILGNDIFAGVYGGGIYRSSDDGINWTFVNNGLGGLEVMALIAKGTTLYAGTYYNGIYKSIDNGNTWTPDSIGLNGAAALSFALIGNNVYVGTDNGVYSRSLGSYWNPVNNGLIHTAIFSLTSSGNNLIAGSFDGYISYSSDAGSSWNTSLQRLSQGYIMTLGVHNNYIFAGTSTHGVYRSSDFGISWTEVNTGLNNSLIKSMAVLDSTIIAGMQWSGIYISNDQGNSWNNVGSGLNFTSVLSLTVIDTTIFAGTNEGLYRSHDHGNSWVSSDSGMYTPQNFVRGIVQNGPYMFAAAYGSGVWRSQDNGVTWILKNMGVTNNQLKSLTVSDTSLILGTHPGLFLSTDYGDSWVPANNGLGTMSIETVFAVGDTVYACPSSYATYRSTDNGNTWLQPGNGIPNTVDAWAHTGSNIFAGNGGAIYRSTDNGISWSNIHTGLPSNFFSCGGLAIMDSIVFAGIHSWGVFKNSNIICNNTSQTINPTVCGTYTSPSGNYTYTSSGAYADTILNVGGCDSIITINLTIVPGTLPIVAITALGSTTFCQGDSVTLSATPGISSYQWYRWNNVIAGATAADYTVKLKGKYKCIAQNSVMCSDTSNIISVRVPCIDIGPNNERIIPVDESESLQIYPNPGTGIFSVESPPGQLQVFNSIGKLILSKEVIDQEYIIDISEFTEGIYMVMLKTEKHSLSHKILISK